MKLELDAPNIGTLEKQYVSQAIDSGFVSTFGPFVPQFEERFAAYVGINNAVSTQSGTAALHMALYELGIGKGDEVIVPVLTFVATVNPVIYVGATPVFVDVDSKSWNIDPDKIEQNITKKTKVILPVHFYGNPCDMGRILDIAKRHDLYVIEDATESLGATYRGRQTGTLGDLGCFSFNGNKIITTGGGGMVVGACKKRMKHIKFLVNQARDNSKGYYHPEIGFNYRMTNMEAAMGLSQLKNLRKFLEKKKTFNAIYKENLGDIASITFQKEYEHAESSYWLSCVLFDRRVDIERLQQRLKSKNIPSRRIFMPVTKFSPYRKYARGLYKSSYDIYRRGLCLPSSTLNSESGIRYVCKVLRGYS